jgi:effector-binding domain-containing protein
MRRFEKFHRGPPVQKLLYGIGGVVVLFLIVGLLLPRQSHFVVDRAIGAPPATVFAQLNDFRRVQLWSPAANIDPNAEFQYSGPARGAGASVNWDGPIAGSGTQTIVESRPYDYVSTLVNAGEPGEARTWFELEPAAGGTRLRWGFEHDYGFNLVGRYVGLFLTGIVRREYARGLEQLAALAEGLPAADFSDLEIERVRVEPREIAYESRQSAPDAASLSRALGAAYFDILNFMAAHELAAAGPPLSIARQYRGSRLAFDAGIPVTGVSADTPREENSVRLGRMDGGDALRVAHTGSYRSLAATHRKIAAYLAALGIERDGDSWESYVSDPAIVPEAELLTYVYYPVRDEP